MASDEKLEYIAPHKIHKMRRNGMEGGRLLICKCMSHEEGLVWIQAAFYIGSSAFFVSFPAESRQSLVCHSESSNGGLWLSSSIVILSMLDLIIINGIYPVQQRQELVQPGMHAAV